MVTIPFISLSAAQHNFEADWVEAGRGTILRQCPICLRDSIYFQDHYKNHDSP